MKKFYTVKEVAEIYALSRSTVYDLVHSGRVDHLSPTRMGNTIRFPKALVDKHVALAEGAA